MSEADLVQALHAVSDAPHYRQWIFEKIENDLGETVFDVGSGLGDFLDLFLKDPKRKIILSDASEIMRKYLRNRCRSISRVQVVNYDISKKDSQPPRDRPSTVTCLNVLEHVEDDVQALKNMRELVGPGGKLVLFVPALEGLYGSLDEMAGHYRRYTPKTLSICLKEGGWAILRLEYFNFFWIFTWFLSGKILRQRQLNAKVCGWLDRIVPFFAQVENVFKPCVGQSLIVIAQKI